MRRKTITEVLMVCAALFGIGGIIACAWIEKNDPAAVYPNASGYCALTCKNGCCPYGGAEDGWMCPDPLDTTKAICFFTQPVGPVMLRRDAEADAVQ